MSFRGLFVGIDRYESTDIQWLTCARRDAVALDALFADTLGGGADCLIDDQATREALTQHFAQLATCDEQDVVVVAFSGHGTPGHQLVTYDANLRDLAATCVPLEQLTEWFTRIPARRLICILDCCFSGGMGAKVLQVDAVARDLSSAASALDQMAGEGRIILTASSATEPAWESRRYGHGLLTHYLLEALQGAEEVTVAGKLSVYQLLEYVTQRVVSDAGVLGQPQHPTLRGTFEGELTWPVFHTGSRYQAAFPEHARAPVTSDVESLAAYGFPPALLSTWAVAIPSLNQLQQDAVNQFGLLDGKHMVVVAPTSSGKTMVGELAALQGALQRKRALVLLPMRALVNDKYRQFNTTYASFGIKTIRVTGEIADDIPELMRGQYDICLMTYEKCTSMMLADDWLLRQVGTIVVDEVQMLADPSRGPNLEFLLTLVRLRRRSGIEPQLIGLSAVIGDANGLDRWLAGRLLRRDERPVPLDEGVLCGDGSFRYLSPEGEERRKPCIQRILRKNSSQDWVIPLVRKLIAEDQQVIVFRETKAETLGVALYLAETLGLPPATAAQAQLPADDLSRASTRLRAALGGGVAFHNADLNREERQVIEEQFRDPTSALRVLVATTTLAMGVNTPASSVIVVGLEHPGRVPYSIAEYKNIIGRAGRLGFTTHGTSYLLAPTPNEEYRAWNHYVLGMPEALNSKFLAPDTDARSLILRVLATAGVPLAEDDIVGFLEESFGAFQRRQASTDWHWDRTELAQGLIDLTTHEFIEKTSSGGLSLTPLGRLAGEGGAEFESIVRLVQALRSVDPGSITDATLITAAQLTREVEEVVFPFNKRSTQKEPQVWFGELRGQRVAASVLAALSHSVTDHHTATLRAKKAVACLLWMTAKPMADMEQVMVQFGGAQTAAGPIRAAAARTRDMIPIVVRVAELLQPDLDLSKRQARLLARLELGLPAPIADLAIHVGNRLTRADYLRLVAADTCTADAVDAADDVQLLISVENSRAKLHALREAVRSSRQGRRRNRRGHPYPPAAGGIAKRRYVWLKTTAKVHCSFSYTADVA